MWSPVNIRNLWCASWGPQTSRRTVLTTIYTNMLKIVRDNGPPCVTPILVLKGRPKTLLPSVPPYVLPSTSVVTSVAYVPGHTPIDLLCIYLYLRSCRPFTHQWTPRTVVHGLAPQVAVIALPQWLPSPFPFSIWSRLRHHVGWWYFIIYCSRSKENLPYDLN